MSGCKFKPVEGKFNEALPVSPHNGPAYKASEHVVRQVFDNPPGRSIRHAGRHRLPAFCAGVR